MRPVSEQLELDGFAEAGDEPVDAPAAESVAAPSDGGPAPKRDRSPALLLLTVAAVLLAVGTAALQGWRDLAEQRAREEALVRDIARTENDVRTLHERIERLQADPVTLERLARHDLGLVRPEDLVIVFPEKVPTAKR